MNVESRRQVPAFETTSLTNKFKSLWLAGIEAKLVFETHAGKAWGTLHVCLGEHPLHHELPPHLQEHPRKRNSPAKQRLRERREAARVEAAAIEAARSEEVAEEATESETAEAAQATVNENANLYQAHDAAEEVKDPAESKATEILLDEICPDDEYLSCQVSESSELDAEKKCENEDEQDLIVVNGVAVFENLPDDIGISQEDINSLHKFICSEQDLRENIANIELDVGSKSEVFVKLHMRKARLKEGAKSYVWKHLGGNNFWTKQNGTIIKLVKIHV